MDVTPGIPAREQFAKLGLTRVEGPARDVAASLGIDLNLGQPLAPADRAKIVTRMARLVMGMIDLQQPGELARRLMVTEPWPDELAFPRATSSGASSKSSVEPPLIL